MDRLVHPIFLLLVGFCNLSFSAWQCPSVDADGQFYVVQSPFIKTSVYKSLDRCKNHSKKPASCHIERAYCQQISPGKSSNSYWQCFAFDRENEKYPSGPYRNRYQAVFAAETLCQRLSKHSTSCNVPLFTCESV